MSEREARDNLVSSLVAGVAAVSGQDVATAVGAGKVEVENNQVAPMAPVPGWLAGFKLPGYKGETAGKGDGVIADPATELDSSAKAGVLVTPNPGPQLIGELITAATPDWLRQIVQAVVNSVGGDSGDRSARDSFEKSLANLPPGERVAQVKQTAQAVAADNGWKKDSQLSRINGRDVYRADDGTLYAVDSQHGRFEMVNGKNGAHMGEVSMLELKPTKPADTSGRHDLKLK